MGNWTENGHLLKQLIELFLSYKEIWQLTVLGYILVMKQGQRSANSTGGGGGGGEKKTRAGDASLLLGKRWGGSGVILSQKRLKSRGLEMVFSTFPMRYFS